MPIAHAADERVLRTARVAEHPVLGEGPGPFDGAAVVQQPRLTGVELLDLRIQPDADTGAAHLAAGHLTVHHLT